MVFRGFVNNHIMKYSTTVKLSKNVFRFFLLIKIDVLFLFGLIQVSRILIRGDVMTWSDVVPFFANGCLYKSLSRRMRDRKKAESSVTT